MKNAPNLLNFIAKQLPPGYPLFNGRRGQGPGNNGSGNSMGGRRREGVRWDIHGGKRGRELGMGGTGSRKFDSPLSLSNDFNIVTPTVRCIKNTVLFLKKI